MRHVCLPVPLPVRLFARMQKLSTHWEIFIKCDIGVSVEILSRKFDSYYNLTRITGTQHEHLRTCTITSRSTLFRMRNVLEKNCRENQNTILCSITFSRKSCRYQIMWKNIVETDRRQIPKYYGACALQLTKASDSHSE